MRLFERYLFPWLPREVPSSKPCQFVYSVEPSGSEGCFHIKRNASIVARDVEGRVLFTTLQQVLDDTLIARLDGRAAIHAGVVVSQGRAILLPGASRAGKTTLVRELIARGAHYSSDEFAVLDSEGLVHPWPRALMVRNECQMQEPILATELGAEVQSEPARVALVVLLNYRPGAKFEVQPLTGSETMIRLLKNTPHVLAENPDILGALAATCRVGLGFEGVRGDAAEAAEALMQLSRAS